MKMNKYCSIVMDKLDKQIGHFVQMIEETDKELVIWGTNDYGQTVKKVLMDRQETISIHFFGDNNPKKWNDYVDGIIVKNMDYFAKDPDKYFVLICSFWENEIANQLDNVGVEYTRDSWPIIYKKMLQEHYDRFDKRHTYNLDIENVWNVFNKAQILYEQNHIKEKFAKVKALLADDYSKIIYQKRIDFLTKGDLSLISDYFTETLEYFQPCYYNEKHVTDFEVLVDCGAYTGDTIESFIDAMHGKYRKIYAYEPDERYYNIASQYIKDKKLNVQLAQKAVGECSGNGNIPIVSLDEDINEKITWIKMDIEGYELSALRGAKKLIQKYRPKLTICLYHNVQDIYEIPLYLNEIVPEYRFKLSQHYRGHFDFILYADTYED